MKLSLSLALAVAAVGVAASPPACRAGLGSFQVNISEVTRLRRRDDTRRRRLGCMLVRPSAMRNTTFAVGLFEDGKPQPSQGRLHAADGFFAAELARRAPAVPRSRAALLPLLNYLAAKNSVVASGVKQLNASGAKLTSACVPRTVDGTGQMSLWTRTAALRPDQDRRPPARPREPGLHQRARARRRRRTLLRPVPSLRTRSRGIAPPSPL